MIDGEDAGRGTAERELELAAGPPPALRFAHGRVGNVELKEDARVGAERHRSQPRVLTGERAVFRDEGPRAQSVAFDAFQTVDRGSVIDDHSQYSNSSFSLER